MTLRVHQYIRQEALNHGTNATEVLGRSKLKNIVEARKAVIRRLVDEGYGVTEIGRWMGRHHSTISYHAKS